MEINMSAKIAKTFVKAVEKLNEESLLVFDDEGLKTKIVDNDNASLLDIKIPKSSANEFSFNGASATEVGVVIERVKDLTKTLTTKDSIKLNYDLENPTWLVMSANGVERKVRLLNSSHMKRVNTPSTEHHWSVSLPMKEIKAFVKSLGKTSSFEINVKDEGIVLYSETDDGEIRLEFDKDAIALHKETGDFTTKISSDKFTDVLSATGVKTIIELKGGDATIVEAQWVEAGMNFVGWIAPLVR